MISRALLNAPFFIPKDADLLRNRKVNTKKRQNRHLPELAFLILGTYFTAPFILFHGIPDKFRENCTILLSPHFKKRFYFLRHTSFAPCEKQFRRKIRIQNITGLHLIRQLVHRSRKNGDSKPFFRQSHRRSGIFTLTVNVTQKPLFFERGQQITAVAVGQDQFLL